MDTENLNMAGSFSVNANETADVWTFVKSIDWTETWLITLVAFHLLLTIVTILTRQYLTVQGFLFVGLLTAVACSENINEFAAQNWKSFSKQQYFDSSGLFISIIMSMPMLFNCLMMVINWIWLSADMMVKVKRMELQKQNKEVIKDLKKEN